MPQCCYRVHVVDLERASDFSTGGEDNFSNMQYAFAICFAIFKSGDTLSGLLIGLEPCVEHHRSLAQYPCLDGRIPLM